MAKLKPCPFCGSRNVEADEIGGDDLAHVRCNDCKAEGPPRDTWAEAVEAWNSRSGRSGDGDGGRRQ